MKVMITILSALIIFFGIIPFFGEKFIIPNQGNGYAIVIAVLGVLLIVSAFMNNLLMGIEKFFLIIQALLLLGIALLRFFPAVLAFMPREGFLYPAMVIVVGAIGFIYGFVGMG